VCTKMMASVIELLRMSRNSRWNRSKFMKGNRITINNNFVPYNMNTNVIRRWKINEQEITLRTASFRHKNKARNVVITFGYK